MSEKGRATIPKDDFAKHIEALPSYRTVELSVTLADEAGSVRSETGPRLPDAMIVASAVRGGAGCLVSNDESLKKAAKFIRVMTAKEFVSQPTG